MEARDRTPLWDFGQRCTEYILRTVYIDMPVASSSRRPRAAAQREHGGEESVAEASHLVSFLTGYDDRAHSDGESSDSDRDADGDPDEKDDYDDDLDEEGMEDEDEPATPTKRAKMGLVGSAGPKGSSKKGTPSKRKSQAATPGSTPRKRRTDTPLTPFRTPAGGSGADGEGGMVRMSRADAYFLHQGRGAKTSGSSYSALARPLTQAQYDRAATARSKGKSAQVVASLLDDLARRYDQWEAELEAGFNLLFYGFGSKRRLLNRFISRRLQKRGHCVVVNGHFPQLGIRDVLAQIEDALGVPQDIPVPPSTTTPLERSAHRIYAYVLPPQALPKGKKHPTASKDLYLLLHNIDAPSLRTPKALGILSLLACSPRIHILASFDHLHTPLLFSRSSTDTPPHTYATGGWDGVPAPSRGFNWLYHNATTYDDYTLELSYQRLSATRITAASSTISEEAALQILRSVPPMALRLLKLLLNKQLASLPSEASSHVAYPPGGPAPVFGVDNDLLQGMAKEKFIAREEERFNALIGEFRDHGLVVESLLDQEGRTGRWVWVPLGKAAVERVLQSMEGVE